jgi:hypothetical protein
VGYLNRAGLCSAQSASSAQYGTADHSASAPGFPIRTAESRFERRSSLAGRACGHHRGEPGSQDPGRVDERIQSLLHRRKRGRATPMERRGFQRVRVLLRHFRGDAGEQAGGAGAQRLPRNRLRSEQLCRLRGRRVQRRHPHHYPERDWDLGGTARKRAGLGPHAGPWSEPDAQRLDRDQHSGRRGALRRRRGNFEGRPDAGGGELLQRLDHGIQRRLRLLVQAGGARSAPGQELRGAVGRGGRRISVLGR